MACHKPSYNCRYQVPRTCKYLNLGKHSSEVRGRPSRRHITRPLCKPSFGQPPSDLALQIPCAVSAPSTSAFELRVCTPEQALSPNSSMLTAHLEAFVVKTRFDLEGKHDRRMSFDVVLTARLLSFAVSVRMQSRLLPSSNAWCRKAWIHMRTNLGRAFA